MKLFSSISLFILLIFTKINGHAQGIEFNHEKTFQELKEEAKSKNKLIFMDCYTTWCGPCKRLAAAVFPDPAVGEYFNAHFVNCKFDMEHGEGPEIAQKYGIHAYPTLLWIDGSGELKHQVVGGLDPNGLIAAGQKAAEFAPAISDEVQKKFDSGDRDPALVAEYIGGMSNSNPNYTKIVTSYLQSLKPADLENKLHLNTVFNQVKDIKSPAMPFFLVNKNIFETKLGKEKIAQRITSISDKAMTNAVSNKSTSELANLNSFLKNIGGADVKEKVAKMNMEFAQKTNNWDSYDKNATAFLKKFGANNDKALNDVAWNYYINIENPNLLMKAKTWAFKAVNLKNTCTNNTTYAYLNYKLGETKEAIKACDYALLKGSEEGANPASAKALKELLQKK